MQKVFEIDGRDFVSLEGFYRIIGRVLIPGQAWGHNLDAFNDILYWPFSEDQSRYTLVWKNSDLSRQNLAYVETIRQLELRIERCHPANVSQVATELEAARRNEGPTVFDWLVEICQGKDQYVELRLE